MKRSFKVVKTFFKNLSEYKAEVLKAIPYLVVVGFMQIIAFFREKPYLKKC